MSRDLVRFVGTLCGCLLLVACVSNTPPRAGKQRDHASAMTAAHTPDDPARRYLALGDSYTIGEGVAEAGRWPVQLVADLRARGIAIGAPEIIAKTGWTTDELAHAMDGAQFDPPYALVTLLIGVNNQYRSRSLANYRDEFTALLKRAIALAGDAPAHVVVVSIPDWGVTRFARQSGRDTAQIGRDIDAFNAAAHAIAQANGVAFADVTPASRLAGTASAMLIEADGLHPSTQQYARWTNAIVDAAARALRAPSAAR